MTLKSPFQPFNDSVTLYCGHSTRSAPLNPEALRTAPPKARTGDAQSPQHPIIQPQRPTSTVTADDQREPGDTTLEISTISASPAPATGSGLGAEKNTCFKAHDSGKVKGSSTSEH